MDGVDLEGEVWLHVQRGCNGVVTGLLLTCSSNGVVIALQLKRLVLHRLLCHNMSQQELLQEAWLGGRDGNLSALSQAKAWSLREVWNAEGKGKYGMFKFISERVTKIGGTIFQTKTSRLPRARARARGIFVLHSGFAPAALAFVSLRGLPSVRGPDWVPQETRHRHMPKEHRQHQLA